MFIKKYKIQILSAEHHSEKYDIPSDALLLGRSHSCDIRFSVPDVSGRHIEIKLDELGQPFLRNLSMRKTLINGEAILHENVFTLHENDKLQLGDDVAIEIICEEDQDTVIPDNVTDSDITILQKGNATNTSDLENGSNDVCSLHSDDALSLGPSNEKTEKKFNPQMVCENKAKNESETMIMQTRIASPEEIDLLRKQQSRGFRKKAFIYFVGTLVAIGIIALGWMLSATNKETSLSWPLDSNGNFNDEVIFPNTETGRDFLIYFPRCKSMKISKHGNDFIAETRIGKIQDVPLRLDFQAFKSIDNLYTERDKGFEKWIESVMQKGWEWNFDAISEVQFRGKDNGLPYLTAKYSRAIEGRSWFGIACYIKFRDWAFVLLKEIPTEERWRGERLLERETFISVSPAFVEKHWEFHGKILAAPISNMLAEAKSMLDRTSPAMWPQISEILISIMVRSLRDNDLKNHEEAQALMQELRQKQTKWLNAEKIEYFNAIAKNKYKDAQKIRENCRRMFSDESDQRFHFIRRDQWE